MKRFFCSTTCLFLLFVSCGHSFGSNGLTYQSVVGLSTGTINPHFVAVGDFNGDGKPDLAVPDFEGKAIAVYLNKGNAVFSGPLITTLSIGNTLLGIVAGDLNGDGKVDLVVGTNSGDQVDIVLLGNGDGTFAAQPPLAGSFGFQEGVIADFNNDGKPDLFLGGNGTAYFYLGNGDGSFSPGTVGQAPFPGTYAGVTTGDFNGDQKLDAVAANFGGGTIDVFPGNGSNSLGNAITSQPPFGPDLLSVVAVDLNHDGKLDLFISGNGAAGGLLGNGDGTFQTEENQIVPIYAESTVDPNNSNVVAIVAADLNQDGFVDAVVLDSDAGLLSLSVNDGTGAFPPTLNTPYTYPVTAGSFSPATADFNGDGLPDIVLCNPTTNNLLFLLSVKPLSKPTISFTSSGASALVGSALTFTTAITGGSATATGTMSLLDGSSQIAQQTLASGGAVFSLSSLTSGVHVLSASYAGDMNYSAGTSAPLNQSITDFQVALASASQTVSAGSPATYTVALTPVAGFTGSVTFACSGLPSLATCNAPALTVAAAAAETVTISTTAATTATHRSSNGVTYVCLLLGCFSLCGLRFRKRGTAHRAWIVVSLFLSCLLLAPMGCGGSPKQTIPGTPSGTSTVTITASATQNGVTVSHAANATLIVQ